MDRSQTISRRLLSSAIFTFVRLTLIALAATSIVRAAGEVDTSFKASLLKVGYGYGQVFSSVIQPDGKIIITGDFTVAVTLTRVNIARLNADGSLDTTFDPPIIVPSYPDQIPAIRGIGLQSDGKIVLGGAFARGVRRLNPDGSDDTAFNSNPWFDLTNDVFDLKVLPDDRIIYSGSRNLPFRNNLTILNADGSVNADSDISAAKFDLQPDGKIIVFENNFTGKLFRINQNLTADSTFTQVTFSGSSGSSASYIRSMVFQPDGKIVIGGYFFSVNGGSLSGILRLNPNGTVDTTFDASGTGAGGAALALQPDGKILAGSVTIDRLNPNGTLDPSFVAPTGFAQVNDLDLRPDGTVLVSCQAGNTVNIPSAVVRLHAGGPLDTSFNGMVGKSGLGSRVIVLPDDKILVAGNFDYTNGLPRRSITRFNADGTLDTTFISQTTVFKPVLNFEAFPDGKIVIGTDTNTYRLNSDGTQDNSFAVGSFAYVIKALPGGKMLVARQFDGSSGPIQRLNSDGTVDPSFGTAVTGRVYKIELQPDGQILIGGDFSQVNGVNRKNMARLNPNGSTDLSLNLPGGTNGPVKDIDLQADGKIVIAGGFTSLSFVQRTGLARLNTDGSLDSGFTPSINSYVDAAKILPDGKILIGGEFSTVDGLPRAEYARLQSDGTLDGGFTVGLGANGYVYGMETQSDGKVIMVGAFSFVNGIGAPSIVRLAGGASVAKFCDYDGDGKSDISVFRPSSGAWYLQRSHAGPFGMLFGLPTDKITPADYDGDGKTDIAVYRPSTGIWYVFNSGDGTVSYYVFGIAEDLPTPADYDGDGKADISVFRPSTGTWYRQNSSNGSFFAMQFGVSEDKPSLGDFDGDGKADVAVFRPSNGVWYRINSGNGTFFYEQFGAGSDLIVPADYDGDGKTDLAVFDPSNGYWNFKRSSTSISTAYPFGRVGDVPAPADFDGDGKADLTVFRPSDGIWYRAVSGTSAVSAFQFGTSGDKPTQAAFQY